MVKIYTKEQQDTFAQKIKKAKRAVKIALCADREMVVKYRKVINDFVRAKRLIIKGGNALNVSLPANKKIYDAEEQLVSDFDILSYAPKKHTIELCNILFKAGIPYIEGWQNYRPFIYSIRIHQMDVVDFVYFPYSIYGRIERVKGPDGLNYVHPNFMRMYTHWIFSASLDKTKLKKEYERLKILDAHYDYADYNVPSVVLHERAPPFGELIKAITKKYIKGNANILLCGYLAYNYYFSKTTTSFAPPHDYLDILTSKPQDAINAIKDILKKELGETKFTQSITIKKFDNFLELIPTYYMIMHDDAPLIMIMVLNDQCITYESNGGQNFVSFAYLLFFYQCITYLALLNKYIRHNTISKKCLYNLFQVRGTQRYIVPQCIGTLTDHWRTWKMTKRSFRGTDSAGKRWMGYKPNDVDNLLVYKKETKDANLGSGAFLGIVSL